MAERYLVHSGWLGKKTLRDPILPVCHWLRQFPVCQCCLAPPAGQRCALAKPVTHTWLFWDARPGERTDDPFNGIRKGCNACDTVLQGQGSNSR